MARTTAEIVVDVNSQGVSRGLSKANQEFDQFDDNVKRASGSTNELAMGAMGQLAAAVSVGAIAKFGFDAAMAADRVEAMRMTVESLSGGAATMQENMDALSRATMGLTSEQERLEIAQQFLGMQLAGNSQELEQVITASTRLGATFRGLGAREAADEFALMVANMSVERLDSFGISSGKVRARIDELLASGEAVNREDAFFKATMEQAEATMKRLGPQLETTTQKVQGTGSAFQDMKVAIGELINATGIIDALAESATNLFSSLAAGANSWKGTIDSIKEIGGASENASGLQLGLATAIQSTGAVMDKLTFSGHGNEEMARKLVDTFILTEQTTSDLGRALETLDQNQATSQTAVQGTTQAYNEFGTQLDYIEQRSIEVGEAEKQRMLDQVAAAEAAAEAQAKAAEEAAARAQAAYEQQFAQVSSTAQSVLGIMQNSDVFQGKDAIFDVASIDANRTKIQRGVSLLASVAANGMTEALNRQLKEKMPDLFKEVMSSGDAKEAAREMLLDFQFGIGTGVVLGEAGREAAKERIKKILIGQAETKELINEITQELIAEGQNAFAVQQAAAQAFGGEMAGPLQMGFGTAEGPQIDIQPLAVSMSEQLNETLPATLQEHGTGGVIIQAITEEMASLEDQFERLADVFAKGFETYLPGRLNMSARLFLETLATLTAQQLGLQLTR